MSCGGERGRVHEGRVWNLEEETGGVTECQECRYGAQGKLHRVEGCDAGCRLPESMGDVMLGWKVDGHG